MQLIPGSRAPISMDLVALAMFVVVPVLVVSIFLVRQKQAYKSHKRLQVALSLAILLVLVVFELEMRTTGWRHLALPSRYYNNVLFPFLYFHITIAVSTTVLWCVTLWGALRHWKAAPKPDAYSSRHKVMGRLSAMMVMTTAFTGWCFFWMAFLA